MAGKAKQVMLAEQWDESIDPTNWWMVCVEVFFQTVFFQIFLYSKMPISIPIQHNCIIFDFISNLI